MTVMRFTPNPKPTIGVEIELQLIDSRELSLKSCIDQVLSVLPDSLMDSVKPELMQCYVEINTKVCSTVQEAGDDLRCKLAQIEQVLHPLGIRLLWAGTHPFSSWRHQKITFHERYHRLVTLMEDVVRRLVTFGLHVHIGVDSGDKAVMICDRMLHHLPLLLALSANSPFWEGRSTGLHSNRSKIMEGLPTAGLPYQMRNWSEYVWLVKHLMDTGFINSIREIWWDIRPHHHFGTIEVRVCDIPPSLSHVLSLTALIQCLVHTISSEIDEGTFQSEYHPMMVEQNKWRATRYGADASLVSYRDFQQRSVPQLVDDLITRLGPAATELQCRDELERLAEIPAASGARRQLEIYEQTGSRRKVVEKLLETPAW
ncbi:MAG: Carboxylate-amine ligase YbdK [Planctomycetota bacterium]|jgi:carboxylate-amine ligase